MILWKTSSYKEHNRIWKPSKRTEKWRVATRIWWKQDVSACHPGLIWECSTHHYSSPYYQAIFCVKYIKKIKAVGFGIVVESRRCKVNCLVWKNSSSTFQGGGNAQWTTCKLAAELSILRWATQGWDPHAAFSHPQGVMKPCSRDFL